MFHDAAADRQVVVQRHPLTVGETKSRGDPRARRAHGPETLHLVELRADDVPGVRQEKKPRPMVHLPKRSHALDLCRLPHLDLRILPVSLPAPVDAQLLASRNRPLTIPAASVSLPYTTIGTLGTVLEEP